MVPVLLLFLLPVGGGIPAGVLLAHSRGLAWPLTAGLYFMSDVLLALAFEPILRLLAAWVRRAPFPAHVRLAVTEATLAPATPTTTVPGALTQGLRADLENLEKLKRDGLISEAEYKDLRQKVLNKVRVN